MKSWPLYTALSVKKQISDKAEACPHCGLPKRYFSGLYIGTETEGQQKQDESKFIIESDYKNIRNMLIGYSKDYADLFSSQVYISTSIARKFYDTYSYYLKILKEPVVCQFISNHESSMGFSHEECKKFIVQMDGLFDKIDQWNSRFIESRLIEYKDYFDNLLFKVDPKVKLDDDQRRALLTDEDYCLVIAGAGAGKTTTMAAKVKYLVDKQNVNPQDIIVISYTNKAIDELKERINVKLNIPAKICTFHSFGFDILKKSLDVAPTILYKSYSIIFEYLERKVFGDPSVLKNLVLFLGYYFDLQI